jgi:hypothetical protein
VALDFKANQFRNRSRPGRPSHRIEIFVDRMEQLFNFMGPAGLSAVAAIRHICKVVLPRCYRCLTQAAGSEQKHTFCEMSWAVSGRKS